MSVLHVCVCVPCLRVSVFHAPVCLCFMSMRVSHVCVSVSCLHVRMCFMSPCVNVFVSVYVYVSGLCMCIMPVFICLLYDHVCLFMITPCVCFKSPRRPDTHDIQAQTQGHKTGTRTQGNMIHMHTRRHDSYAHVRAQTLETNQ